jgi:hypothetical protein
MAGISAANLKKRQGFAEINLGSHLGKGHAKKPTGVLFLQQKMAVDKVNIQVNQ